MCYICNCFGWALDMLQRLITFVLACILMFVVCTGMAVAISAGIAYGYNYSMAEFLTFTRQDVTVYMRRGQFYDKPDVDLDRDQLTRRKSNEGVDNFVQNETLDYQEVKRKISDTQALPKAWDQAKDSRSYAEVLTKYSGKTFDDQENQQMSARKMGVSSTPPPRVPMFLYYPSSVTPYVITNFESTKQKNNEIPEAPITYPLPATRISSLPLIQTTETTIRKFSPMERQTISGPPEVIMRKFWPSERHSYPETSTLKIDKPLYHNFDYLPVERRTPTAKVRKITVPPDINGVLDNIPKSRPYKPIVDWNTKAQQDIHEYPEEVDEDNVVYKAV